jgi:hypothetical protein
LRREDGRVYVCLLGGDDGHDCSGIKEGLCSSETDAGSVIGG